MSDKPKSPVEVQQIVNKIIDQAWEEYGPKVEEAFTNHHVYGTPLEINVEPDCKPIDLKQDEAEHLERIKRELEK